MCCTLVGYLVMILRRFIWAGIAFLPGAAAAAVQHPDILSSSIGASGLASASSFAALAVMAASQERRRRNRSGTRARLLKRGALQRLSADLPAKETQLSAVSAALVPGTAAASAVLYGDEPETRDVAMARMLHVVLTSFGADRVEDLEDTDLAELYLLLDLFTPIPGKAGRLALYFRLPAEVLDLRDQLAQVAETRRTFEQQKAVFQAARAVWRSGGDGQRHGLMGNLRAMRIADPDLWHAVVAGHDMSDPAQRDAALWCLSQPLCDQASVALYLRRMLAEGVLETAMNTGDAATMAAALAAARRRTGKSGSLVHVLDLPATADPAGDAARLAKLLEEACAMSGFACPTIAAALFNALPGRAVQSRSGLCLRTGRMSQAPRWADYVDAGRVAQPVV